MVDLVCYILYVPYDIFMKKENLPRVERADEIANEIVATFDIILIRFGIN